MATGAGFLGGAKSRLLPASVPFRYFGAATGFQALAWVCVLAGAADLPGFAGALGWPLAALHAVTLGVLTMTAVGASLQLLPVATRQPVGSARLPTLLWWLLVPGVALLVAGMAHVWPALLAAGAALVVPALLAYGVLLAANLARGRGMPVVAAHGWGAVLGLAVLLASGTALVLAWLGLPTLPRSPSLGLHVAFAAFGFMGLLVLGFGHILVPMFAVGEMAPVRPAYGALALALAALALAAAGAFGIGAPASRGLAILAAFAAVAWHVVQMRQVMAGGMRRDLGASFRLVFAGWAGVAAATVAAASVWIDDLPGAGERAPAFFGALVALSLLTFLLGMFARIVPFLASMHATPGRRGPPTPTSLTAERPLAVGIRCHCAASALLLAGVLIDSAWVVRGAGAVGLAGAAGWALFVRHAWQRMRAKPARAADLN